MAGGDAALTGLGSNWDLVRLDGDTGVAHFAPANVVFQAWFRDAITTQPSTWNFTDAVSILLR